MKRKLIVVAFCCMMLGMGACGAKEEKAEPFSGEPITTIDASSEDQNQGNNASESQNQTTSGKVQEFFANGVEAADFNRDYDADIQANIDAIAFTSVSVQEELKAVAKIAEQFDKLAGAANTQVEMNQSSKWFYVIWDKELNSLWSRISSQADAQTKEELLAEQRNWVSMKEEVTLENIGSSEENGSMYPTQQYGFWEEITRNRVYVLAKALAKIKGESFAMPERNAKYGTYVNNEGTGSVYDSLITRKSWEGEDEALIALYRTGVIEGTFVDQGNGKLAFTSYDGKVKGTIALKGWDGASFEVTEASDDAIVNAGEKYDFNFVY